jgi:hypothetical protein
MSFLAGAGLALAAGFAAHADGVSGVFAPAGGHAGALQTGGVFGDKSAPRATGKSGAAVFGKTGGKPAGKFAVPAPQAKGGAQMGFDGGMKGGGHHGRGKKFPRHGFPVIVYPYGASYAVATGGEDVYADEDYGESAEADGADDGVFAITNRTDAEMTVYDNGKPVCVLAPGVRCSFDVSKGTHDVSARVGKSEARREIPRSTAGKLIVVWEALRKAE